MKKIILYSPGISSTNIGDEIISEAAKYQLSPVFENAFVTEISTHLPYSHYYLRHLRLADYKFVLGSNLLKSTFFGLKRQWDITLRWGWAMGPCVLIGAGWWQYNNRVNGYTKLLYRTILHKEFIHSVRDEYTEGQLRSAGIKNVINTGCPTMWELTEAHCSEISSAKKEKVVFTLTDYNKNPDLDRSLIDVLSREYSQLYFWPQGLGDFEYISQIYKIGGNLKILKPSLSAFNEQLATGEVDYVGTRLHGGIRALQKKVRALIIGIDNRALEKKKVFNLPVVFRDDVDGLSTWIRRSEPIQILLDEQKIERWKSQFI